MTCAYNDDTRAKSQEPRLEVYVATHKPIDFPLPDYCRKIQVNAESTGQWPGYLHDNDSPDNISSKNPYYSELTALYAMWKNCDADIQGLYHYRRYMSGNDSPQDSSICHQIPDIMSEIITREKIIQALSDADIILSIPYAPYPLNVLEDLKRYVCRKDIREFHSIMAEYYPDYLPYLDSTFSMTHISYCNMFIARRDFVDGYCTWMFDVMKKLEDRISLQGSDNRYTRIFGYFTEVMLNVYVQKHKLKAKYSQLISPIENKSRIKTFLKKIPGLQAIFHAITPRGKEANRRNMSHGESTRRFIAGLKDIYPEGICVPDISGLKKYVHFIGFHEIESGTAGNFMYILATNTEWTSGGEAVIAIFMPKTRDDIGGLPEAVRDVTGSVGDKFGGAAILPEVILSGEVPAYVAETLGEVEIRAIMLQSSLEGGGLIGA